MRISSLCVVNAGPTYGDYLRSLFSAKSYPQVTRVFRLTQYSSAEYIATRNKVKTLAGNLTDGYDGVLGFLRVALVTVTM